MNSLSPDSVTIPGPPADESHPKGLRRLAIVSGIVIGVIVSLVFGCSHSTAPVKFPSNRAAILSIDTATSLPGRVVLVNLRLERSKENDAVPDTLHGFDLYLCYESDRLTLLPPVLLGPTISSWQSLDYRISKIDTSPDNWGMVRIVGDLTYQHFACPDGILLTLRFRTSSEPSQVDDNEEIGFYLRSWHDNSISLDQDGFNLCTPDTSLGHVSRIVGYDTLDCPRLYKLRPVLELKSGWIRIVKWPPDSSDVDVIGTFGP